MSGLDVEVVGDAVAEGEVARLVTAAVARSGIAGGQVAVDFVDAERINEFNLRHRGKEGPTDVLSFPVDEEGEAFGPRELGDVVICPAHTEDLREAVVHGALHLVGYDHETDDGEMLRVQDELMEQLR